MSPARLLEHFDRLIDTPDAVPRLRRFILDLAVRGKLVEQDPVDEPGGDLLEALHKERERLISRGAIKGGVPTLAIGEDEVPFTLPRGWALVRLGDALELFNGRPFKPTEWSNTGRPIVRIQNLNDPAASFNYCSFAVPDNYCIKTGDFLISWSGTPGTSFGAHIWERGAAILNQHIFKALLIGAVFVPRFLKLAINSRLLELIEQAHGGVGLQHITKPKLERLPLTLPPLAEQHRIVAKVDELMALCDELEAAQTKREKRRDRLVAATLHGLNNGDATPTPGAPSTFEESAHFYFNHLPRLTTRPEHIHQLRQTILNLAIRGMLVPHENTGTTTADTLSRIQAEKSRLATGSRLKKDKLLAEVPDGQLPFSIPGNWEWIQVGSVSLLVEYGTSVKSDSQVSGVPVLRMGDIQDGRVSLVVQKKVPRSIPDLPRLFLKHKDILYNRTNSAELVGKTGIFLGEDDTYTFASYLIRIRVLEVFADPTYMNFAMNAPYFRETQILPQLQQQCGQANVNGTKLRNMLIPLPPITEQHRIVAKVDELMALCNGVEAGLTSSAARRGKCLESMLGESLKRIATMAV